MIQSGLRACENLSLVNNQIFFLLFSIVAVALTAAQKQAWRKQICLALVNLAFIEFAFMWRERSLIILALILIGNFAALKIIQFIRPGAIRTVFCWSLVVIDVFLLTAFNYPNFLEATPIFKSNPIYLVGLSFGALRLLHLCFEVKADSLEQKLTALRYVNYMLFFPAYLSGPLTRYDELAVSLESPIKLTAENIYYALERIIAGLFKFSVIAYFISFFSLHTFGEAVDEALSPLKLAISLGAFGLWLYFSFSGITDLAIGIGKLLGVNLPENFDRPFRATNIQEFWQRWHMSLLTWVRTYLFQPLQIHLGSLLPNFPGLATATALFLSFTLLGLWHGDAFHFLLYGVYHGVGMMLFFLYSRMFRSQVKKFCATNYWRGNCLTAASWLLTWNYIAIGWLFYLGKQNLLFRLVHSSWT